MLGGRIGRYFRHRRYIMQPVRLERFPCASSIQRERETEIYIFYAESKDHWYGMPWYKQDWLEPIEDRFWTICKLRYLVKPTPEGRLCR